MSSKKLENFEKYKNFNLDLSHNSSKLGILFSNFFKKKTRQDIYIGNEEIPFKERHPIYKTLLRIEFEEAIKEYLNL